MSPSPWAALARTPGDALGAGIQFLRASRNAGGWWEDFLLAPGWSDEWVTGYVADRISCDRDCQVDVHAAWGVLRDRVKQRTRPGWGFNAIVPDDADSTTWALRTARAAGAAEDPTAKAAAALIDAYRCEGGMLATYEPGSEIRAFIGRDTAADMSGWTAPHACVTAAAAGVGIVDVDVLLDAQQSDGSWESYWWPDPGLATALACEAIAALAPDASDCLDAAARWALEGIAVGPLSAFDLANRMIIAVESGHGDDERVSHASRELAYAMRPDGSWSAGARLRVPFPADVDPSSTHEWIEGGRIEGAVIVDARRVFTTATVVRALWCAGARIHSIGHGGSP